MGRKQHEATAGHDGQCGGLCAPPLRVWRGLIGKGEQWGSCCPSVPLLPGAWHGSMAARPALGWVVRSSTSSRPGSNLLFSSPQTYVFTDEEDDALKRRMGNHLSHITTSLFLPSVSELAWPLEGGWQDGWLQARSTSTQGENFTLYLVWPWAGWKCS